MQVAPSTSDDASVVAPSILTAARRYLPLLVAISATTGFLGLLWGATRPTDEVATARVVLRDPNGAEVFVANEVPGDDERFVRTQARFLRSDAVLENAATSLDISLNVLDDAVTVGTGADDDVLVVSVRSDSAADSEQWLGAVLDAYREARKATVADELAAAVQVIDALVAANADSAVADTLQERAAQLEVNAAVYGDGVGFVEAVEITSSARFRSLVINGFVGGLAGLAIGLFVAWQLADQNPLVRSANDVRRLFGVPLLGRVPDLPAAALEPGANGSFESVALGIESRLMSTSANGSDPINRSLVVVGDEPGVGVSTTVNNVAATGAENGLRVYVVDASGHSAFTPTNGESNTSYTVETIQKTNRGMATVMRPDVANGGSIHEMYRSGELEAFVARTLEDYDFILFDCPPLSVDTTALRLAPIVDAAIVIVRDHSRLVGVEETLDLLVRVDLPILGYVHTFEPVSSR